MDHPVVDSFNRIKNESQVIFQAKMQAKIFFNLIGPQQPHDGNHDHGQDDHDNHHVHVARKMRSSARAILLNPDGLDARWQVL